MTVTGTARPAQRSAAEVVVLGTSLGTATGGLIGVAVIWASALLDPPELLDRAGSLLGLSVVAFGYGAVAGLVDSLPAAIVLAPARRRIGESVGRARLTAASAAAVLPAALTVAQQVQLSTGVFLTAACAIGAVCWAKQILGLPRASARRRSDRAAR